MASWTDKQKRFVEEYCRDFNGAGAARRAGYSEKTAKQAANRNLNDDDIRQAIEERLDELAMSAGEATKRMGEIARAEISRFFEVEEVTDPETGDTYERLTLDREAVLEHGDGIVKEISWDKNGRPKLKLYDAQKALETLMKAHGEFEHPTEVDVQGLGDFLAEGFESDG